MSNPLAPSERAALLREYFEAREKLYDLSYRQEQMDTAERAAQIAALGDRLADLWDRYVASVPVLPISRCPFTGAEVTHSLDTAGLDGLWWNYEAPARPSETLPRTYFALAGAVRLGEPLESFPFQCMPGPEVPYVVPRLLARPEVRAVVSSVQVGPHTAYPIFYFADPFTGYISRVNTWGTAEFWFDGPDGRQVWDSVDDERADFDFDLERWIQAGKLLWIAPGDARLTLRSHTRACPYIGLRGRRHPLYLTMGTVSESVWPEELAEDAAALVGTGAVEEV